MTARERATYTVRTVVAHALYYTGVLHVLLRLRLRRKAVVLAYHRVLTPSQRARTASQDGLIVEDRTFARHMALLSRLFSVLTLDEFAEHMAMRRPFRGPCCLITFDDGWIDNFENALPVLRGYGMPAVLFLPVNFIGRRRLFVREALTHLLVHAVRVCRAGPGAGDALRARLAPLGLESALDIQADDPLPQVLTLLGAHRYASGPEFEALVDALEGTLGAPIGDLSDLDSFVDWDQVRRLGRDGFSFGGHGAEHRVLSEVSPTEARCEIASSKRLLDERVPQQVDAFAYPNGGWNAEIAQMVRAAGYRLAFTIDPGFVDCKNDPMTLPRLNVHEGMTGSTPMFMSRLAGIF